MYKVFFCIACFGPNQFNVVFSGGWAKVGAFLYDVLTFLILYNNLIPISLTVTVEVVRFIQVAKRLQVALI